LNFDEILDTTTDVDVIISLLSSCFLNEDKDENSKYIIEKKPIHTIYNEGLENYIAEPFISICKNSWEKNLFTKESIVEKKEYKVIYNSFDENNTKIFDELVKKDKKHYEYSLEGDPVIKVKATAKRSLKSISDELVVLSAALKLQDISIGYMNKKEFLMDICSCEKVEGIKEHTKDWEAKFVYDPDKVEKSFEEYLKQYSYENLYIQREERIYKDQFYLNAHLKYLNSLVK
jgi:ferredoxin-thioredoxin reductase catalytic subunit